MAAGLKVVALSALLDRLGVAAAAQDSDDPDSAQELRYLPSTDPQGVGPLQPWWGAGRK